jgi:hypothetical protein
MSYLFKMRIRPDYVKLLDLLAQVLSADNYLSFGGADDNERLSMPLESWLILGRR